MRSGRTKEPVRIGRVVGRVLGDLGLEAAATAYQVSQHWEAIVGPESARHSRPVAIRGQLLEAEVDSSVWCQQLQMRREQILAALRRQLGEASPTDLRFRVGYTRSP
ncbi:MAG: DUF721 domain-containing protein [Myxococcota bacterium]